jgi:hypothetical protein
MVSTELPQVLNEVTGSENRDFSFKAGSSRPFRKSLPGIISGILWIAFFSLIFFGIFDLDFKGMLERGAEENKSINPAFYLMGFFGIFYLIGLAILFSAIIPAIRRGGYFIGTPVRLINYRNGNIRSVNWEQFTGDMQVRGKEQGGNISFLLKTGTWKRQKGGSIYVPDMIFMTAIPGLSEVEKICRQRIKENKPAGETK